MEIDELLEWYRNHPEFLGIQLVDPNQRGAMGDGPLHIAARAKPAADVQALIDAGADVNLPGDMGNTPLHYAAMSGRIDVVELLINAGAMIAATNELGQTALRVAQLGQKDLVAKRLGGKSR